jgi:hypothetical protein
VAAPGWPVGFFPAAGFCALFFGGPMALKIDVTGST